MNDRTDEILSTRYPRLREDQIEVLSRSGQTRKTEAGEVLFRAGDTSNDTLALESVALGGQAGTSSRIENYLGFPAGLSGFELASRALAQADKFGARTAVPEEAVSLKREDGYYRIELSEGGHVVAHGVIAASGARYRRLDVHRLERFEGISIHYAATEAEPQRCEGEEAVVVGGSNSAGQAAVYLAGRTRRVYLIIRGGDLGKGMSRYLVDRVTRVPGTSRCSQTPRLENSWARTA